MWSGNRCGALTLWPAERMGCGGAQHSILYWVSSGHGSHTSTLLCSCMYVGARKPLWHIREEMSEQCSVSKITTSRWHKIGTQTHTHTYLHKPTQRLLSTEGFANNEVSKWPLWEWVDNLLYTIPASAQREQDEGIKEDKEEWKRRK